MRKVEAELASLKEKHAAAGKIAADQAGKADVLAGTVARVANCIKMNKGGFSSGHMLRQINLILDTPVEPVKVTVREDGDLFVDIRTFHTGGEIVTKARTLSRLLNLKVGDAFLAVPLEPLCPPEKLASCGREGDEACGEEALCAERKNAERSDCVVLSCDLKTDCYRVLSDPPPCARILSQKLTKAETQLTSMTREMKESNKLLAELHRENRVWHELGIYIWKQEAIWRTEKPDTELAEWLTGVGKDWLVGQDTLIEKLSMGEGCTKRQELEMPLDEYMARLPDGHRARKALELERQEFTDLMEIRERLWRVMLKIHYDIASDTNITALIKARSLAELESYMGIEVADVQPSITTNMEPSRYVRVETPGADPCAGCDEEKPVCCAECDHADNPNASRGASPSTNEQLLEKIERVESHIKPATTRQLLDIIYKPGLLTDEAQAEMLSNLGLEPTKEEAEARIAVNRIREAISDFRFEPTMAPQLARQLETLPHVKTATADEDGTIHVTLKE
jgi:hypothetical protein